MAGGGGHSYVCSSSSTVINLSWFTPYLAVFAMNVCSRDAAKTFLGGGVYGHKPKLVNSIFGCVSNECLQQGCSENCAGGGGVKLPDFLIYVPFYTTSIRVFQGYAFDFHICS